VATVAGTAQAGDGGAPTALCAARGLTEGPLLWLQVPGASRYPEEIAAALLAAQLGRVATDVVVVEVEEDAGFAIPAHQQPLSLSRRLDAGPESAAGAALLRSVRRALEGAPREGLVLAPPVLGQRAAVAARWRAALEEAAGRPVVELLGIEDSAHGFRLWRSLREALEATDGIEVVQGPLQGLTLEARGGQAQAATLGLKAPRRVEGLRGVVLATGAFLGGGRRAVEPLREALLGLPLWLGGEVMDNDARHPTVFLGERPWGDHALWRLGVGIDAQSRALGADGRAAWGNVYAAGRLLGGTHAALDGSAQGVDLITGLRAGQAAARQGRS
jgi:anaerobic glycerol-3-phosphate dehydrogenase